ncbi:immunoglobulin domain-containing protein [Actomonas aquatica]|uniref:Immunoglobulin domain-containing protein n=1 Tax=Actomonas aquatica TaxID=2866162 RepID=A0ABZ1C5S8_9BACT|nr:immunoglobulin domain-containing protein [Opitutus sp. WL0086]WRQ87010.1 immunoglobulin domain-containing protein [Opitutus sp. WL0086]
MSTHLAAFVGRGALRRGRVTTFKLFAGLALLLGLLAGRATAVDLDLAFDADVRKFGSGRAVAVQDDGKVLIGGQFSSINGFAQAGVTRLNADGSRDTDFDVGSTLNGTVTAIVVQPDGKILIGGSFTEFAAGTHNRILRLNADGSLDTSFNAGSGFNGSVLAMVRQDDGKVIVGGGFTTYNGTSQARIVRLNTDGSIDTGFNPGSGANDSVWDLALQSDGKVVVTGSFTAINGTTRNRIARLNSNGSLDTGISFGTGANWGIYAVVIDNDGGFVVGGGFSTLNDTTRRSLGRFTASGALDTEFDPSNGLNGFVADLQLDSAGRVVVAGAFTGVYGDWGSSLPGLLRLQGGAVDEGFSVGYEELILTRSSYVTAIQIAPGDRVVAAGHFYDADSGSAGYVRLASSGALDTTFTRSRGLEVAPAVRTLVQSSQGRYYVGGDFDWIGGAARQNIARFTADAAIDTSFNPSTYYAAMDFDGLVTAIVERSDGQVWAFGTFSHVANSAGSTTSWEYAGAVRFAPYGDIQSSYDGSISVEGGYVGHATTDSTGRLILAGNFTGINGTARAGVARVSETGVLDTTFAPGSGPADGSISGVDVLSNDDVLVSGSFTNFSGAGEAYLVRLSATNGAVDTTFAGNTVFNGIVNSVAVLANDQIVVGGNFTSSGGYTVNGIDRLNTDGTSDPNFLPGAGAAGTYPYVYAARPDSSGRIVVAGTYTSLRGEARPGGLGRMTANGPLDPLFDDTSLDGGYASDSLTLPDGKILVRGSFTGINGEPRVALARFHGGWVLRGGLDSAFDGAQLATNTVRGVLPATDGGYWIFGDFTTIAGQTRNRIAKLDRFGLLDPSFAPVNGFNGNVNGARLLADGGMLVWGQFSSYEGAVSYGVAKLTATGARDESFTPPVLNGAAFTVAPYGADQWLVGGNFSNAGGTAAGGLVRLNADGSRDTSLVVPSGTAGTVQALAVSDAGAIYVGGSFTQFAGQPAAGLVRLSSTGAIDETFAPGEGSAVWALHLDADGGIWVGGDFASWDGTGPRGLVRLLADGSMDTDFMGGLGSGIYSGVRVLSALPDGRVFVGGRFTALGGGERRGLARVYPSGTIDPYFDIGEGFNNEVMALTPLADGRLAVGGSFTQVRGEARNRVAVIYAGDDAPPFIADDAVITREIDPGEDLTLSYALIEGMSYQWYRDGVRLPEEVGHELVITDAGLEDIGLYTVRFSNGAGEYVNAGTQVIVRLAPAVSSAPVNTAVGYGANATFAVGVVGPGPFTYAWYRDGELIAGADESTLTVGDVGDGDFGASFYAVVTNAYGSITTGAVSLDFDSTAVPGALREVYSDVLPQNQYARVALRTPDGSTYLGGSGFLIRLRPDGSVDDSFSTNFTSLTVEQIALQSDGKLVVGGYLWPAGGSPQDLVRLLPSGAVDPTFESPRFNGVSDINALLLQTDGKIIVAGRFFSIGGVDRQHVARFNTDGSLDEGFGPSDDTDGPSDEIASAQLDGDKLIVAGTFATWGGTTVNHLARLNANGSLDTSFGGGLRANDDIAEIIPAPGGTWLIRGVFTTYGGVARPKIARLLNSGALDTTFSPGSGPESTSSFSTGSISGMAVESNGSIVVVGGFSSFNGWPAQNSVRLTSTGAIDTEWATPIGTFSFTNLLQLSDGTLLAGGTFDLDFDSTTDYARSVRILSGVYPPQAPAITWQTEGYANAVDAGSVRVLTALASGPGELQFQWYRDGQPVIDSTLVTGATTGRLSLRSLLPTDAGSYVLRVTSAENGFVESAPITIDVGAVPTGLGSADPTWSVDTAAFDPHAFTYGPDGSIYYVSGRSGSGYQVNKLNADGITVPLSEFNPGVSANNVIQAVALQSDGKVVIGGNFVTLDGTDRPYLARLNADGSLDTSFQSTVDGAVRSLRVLPDNRILVGGSFNTISGTSRRGLARLNANGSYDASFGDYHNLNSVLQVELSNDGSRIFAMGTNSTAGRMELVRLESNGTLSPGFNTIYTPFNQLNSFAQDASGRIYVGGYFTSVSDVTVRGLARLSATGVVDTSFGPVNSAGPGGTVTGILAAPDGFLYVAGTFGTWDGFALGGLVRLDANGQLDLAFPADGLQRVRSVSEARLDWTDTGKLLLAGDYSYAPKRGFVRFNVDGGPTGALQVIDASGDRAVVEGVDVALYARVVGGGPITYQWSLNGVDLVGAIGPQLLLDNPTQDQAGVYTLTATNGLGSVTADMTVGFLGADPLSPIPGIAMNTGIGGNAAGVTKLSDGSRIVYGSFSSFEGVTLRGIAKLRPDGSLDSSFNNNLPFSTTSANNVYQIIEEPSGTLLVLGRYLYLPDNSRLLVVRLNANGTLAQTLVQDGDLGNFRQAYAIARLADGGILLAGFFAEFKGTAVSNLIKLHANGTLDTSFLPGGVVSTANNIFEDASGRFYVTGTFTSIGGQTVPRTLMIRLNANGTWDESFAVTELAYSPTRVVFGPQGELYASGNQVLATIDGEGQRLVRLSADGALDRSFKTEFSSIYTFAMDPLDRLVVVGQLPVATPNTRLARLLNNGSIDRSVVMTGSATYLERDGDNLLILTSGNVNNVYVRGISLLNAGGAEPFALVETPQGGNYIPGNAVTLGVGVRGADQATYQWYHDGEVIAGATDPALFIPSFAPSDAGAYTLDITVDGETSTTDPVDLTVRSNAGRAGEIDLTWGVGGSAYSLGGVGEDAAGNLYAFNYSPASGIGARVLVAWDELGQERTDFTLDARFTSGTVRGLYGLPDGKLLVFGQSLRIDTTNTAIVRLLADGTIDSTFDYTRFTSHNIMRVTPMEDGRLFLLGSGLAGINANFAIVDTDGTLDGTMNPMTGVSVSDAAPAGDGKWWVRGNYLLPDSNNTRVYVWRINADGSFDSSYAGLRARYSESIQSIAAAPDGAVYVLSYHYPSGLPNVYTVRKLLPDGTFDASFNTNRFEGTSATAQVPIGGMASDSQGRLVLTGNFRSYDGVARNRVLRLLPDGSADPSFVSVGTDAPTASSSYPNFLFIAETAERILVFQQTLSGFGNVTDRSGLYALHNGEIDPAATPELTASAAAVAAYAYEPVSLGLPVYAPADATVQWFKDGSPIAGAVSWGLSWWAVPTEAAGAYHATITTAGGSLTTPSVSLSVERPVYSGALSSNNAGATVDSRIELTETLPDGRVFVVARHGAFVDGAGPYQLFFLNPDGTLDHGLPTTLNNTQENRYVYAVEIDDNGRIYLGGLFTTVNGQSRANLVRLLPDGSIDSSFAIGTGPNSAVRGLAFDGDGKLLAAGQFSQWNGQTSHSGTSNSLRYLVRLNSDGSLDPTLAMGTGFNNYLFDVAVDAEGGILVGGYQNLFNGFTSRYLSRLTADGSIDALFSPVINNVVQRIRIEPETDRIGIQGTFTSVDSTASRGFAWLNADGTLNQAFNIPVSPSSLDVAADGSVYYTSGYYPYRMRPDGTADSAFSAGNNTRGYFEGENNSQVTLRGIAATGNQVLVFGDFVEAGEIERVALAWLEATDGAEAQPLSWVSAPTNISTVPGGRAVWTSQVSSTGGGTVTYTWTKDGLPGQVLSTGSSLSVNNVTAADAGTYRLVVDNGLATLTAVVQLSVGDAIGSGPGSPRIDFFSEQAATNDRSVLRLLDGSLLLVGGTSIRRVDAYGATVPGYTPLIADNQIVGAEQGPDGALYVWGSFETIGGHATAGLARFTANGTVDTGFVSPFTGLGVPGINAVAPLAAAGDGLYIVWSGNLELDVAGTPTLGLARLLGNGDVDTSFNPNGGVEGTVQSMLVQPDGRPVIVGNFTAIGAASRSGVARLNADGSLDTSFNNIAVSNVQRIHRLPDGRFLIGGSFTTVDGLGRPRLARLDANGFVDQSFGPLGFDFNNVYAFAVRPDGRIVVAGYLGSGAAITTQIAQFLPDGSLDTTFDSSFTYQRTTGSYNQASITDLEVLANGDIAVMGNLILISNEVSRTGLARIHGTPLAPGFFGAPRGPRSAGAEGSVTYTADAYGSGALTYQWRKDGTPIDGGTDSTLELSALTAADAGDYDVIVTSDLGSATSPAATLEIVAPPTITSDPIDVAVPLGEPASFAVAYSASGVATVQWFFNDDPIVGATGDTLNLTAVTLDDAGDYTAAVTNEVGTTVSASATLTVQTAPEISVAPVGGTFDPAATVELSVEATGNPMPTYQWFKDGEAITDAMAATLTLTGVTRADAGSYTVTVTNVVDAVTSGPAVVVVNYAPGITSQPVDVDAVEGDRVELSVIADGLPAPTYQWFFNGGELFGRTDATLVIDSANAGHNGFYTVEVTNAFGSDTSDPAEVVVAFAPIVISHPTDTTVNAGSTLELSAQVIGLPTPTLQWRFNGTPIDGATGSTLTVPNAQPADAGSYDVVYQNSQGSGTTNAALVTVNYAPAITTQPTPVTLNAGQGTSFSVAFTGHPTPTVQWFFNGEAIAGATGPSLALSDLQAADAGDYHAVVTNARGSATSDVATLTVQTAPVINEQPISETVNRGKPVSFTVVAEGLPTPTYQWRKDGAPISGATAATYAIAEVQADDAGSYDVVVTNAVGSVTSAAATLTVNVGPEITTQPQDAVVLVGDDVTLSVSATGGDPLTYQWRKDGTPIPGATSSTFELFAVTEDDLGDYDVVVTDPVDSVTSNVALVVVAEVVATHSVREGAYVPGGTITIDVVVEYSAAVTSLQMPVLLPAEVGGEAWSYVSGSGAQFFPGGEASLFASWSGGGLPQSAFDFSYTLNVPSAAAGDYELTAWFNIGVAGETLQDMVTPDPLMLTKMPATHSADSDANFELSLSELLRVIELYNTRLGTARTGRYVPAEGTEDGFASDPTTAAGTPPAFTTFHSADSNRDGELSLSELLRVIELYNTRDGTTRTGRYHVSPGTEDGFAAGPGAN